MYIKKIKIMNQGPIKDIEYFLPFKDNKPIPVVLTGINGSGKTIVLSDIISAYINLKSNAFVELPEINASKLYKVQGSSYTNENYTYVGITFDDSFYAELSIKNQDEFFSNFDASKFEYLNITRGDSPFFLKSSFLKTNNFNEVFLYYPVDRYYKPAWLNVSNEKISFNSNYNNFFERDDKNSIVYDMLENINQWILDVIMDMYLYEMKTFKQQDGDVFVEKQIFDGPNQKIHKGLNDILTSIMRTKDINIISARFGISSKTKRKISIHVTKADNVKEYEYADSFSHLSSGEVMVFSMFANIIKNSSDFSSFDDLKGVVLIDEIDENLHINICKEVLPYLINFFPKIQFVISTHSPFFLLGMNELFKNKFKMINLPEFEENLVENFSEIKQMYDLVNKDYKKILNDNKKMVEQLSKFNKTIIIGEGKTDIYHLENSLKTLKKYSEFKQIDVEFYSAEECNGNSKMNDIVRSIAKCSCIKEKIIAIFDSDDNSIKGEPGEMICLGNNVYQYKLPNIHNIPGGASIEFMYDINDIKIVDSNGRRLYLSSDFTKTYILKDDSSVNCGEVNKIDNYYSKNQDKIIDNKVFKDGKNISLSKKDFANHIRNKDIGYENVSIDGFKEIWNEIKKIIVS